MAAATTTAKSAVPRLCVKGDRPEGVGARLDKESPWGMCAGRCPHRSISNFSKSARNDPSAADAQLSAAGLVGETGHRPAGWEAGYWEGTQGFPFHSLIGKLVSQPEEETGSSSLREPLYGREDRALDTGAVACQGRCPIVVWLLLQKLLYIQTQRRVLFGALPETVREQGLKLTSRPVLLRFCVVYCTENKACLHDTYSTLHPRED